MEDKRQMAKTTNKKKAESPSILKDREKTVRNSKLFSAVTDWRSFEVTSTRPQRHPRLIKKTLTILAGLAFLARIRDEKPPARMISMDMKN
jgi:hypothetical protein